MYRSYPGTWSKQIFKPLANCFSKPSFSCHCSPFHHCYLSENRDSKSSCKEDEVCLVFGSLTVPEPAAAISYCSQLDGRNIRRLGSSAISEHGQENSFLKENVENHCNRCSFYLKYEFGHPEQGGWIQSQMATKALEPNMRAFSSKDGQNSL